MKKSASFTLAVLVCCLFLTQAYAGDRPKADVLTPSIDAIGEFLRGSSILAGGVKALPPDDQFLEKLRTLHEIPERIPVLSPRGGNAVVVFIFDGERLPVIKGVWGQITPNEYKYLQTYHNLKTVYCLHENEPVDLGDNIIAVKPGSREIAVYFNDKKGNIDSASIHAGNSAIFSHSRFIVKPVVSGF